MNDERDDLLREIGQALRAEPTPEFVARVRTRVESRANRGTGWRWLSLVTAAVVTLVVAGVWRPSDSGPELVVRPATTTAAARPSKAVVAPPQARGRPRTVDHRVARGVRPESVAVSGGMRDVQVPPERALSLRQLLEDVAEGRTAVESVSAQVTASIIVGPLQPPDPIVISELVIEPLPLHWGS